VEHDEKQDEQIGTNSEKMMEHILKHDENMMEEWSKWWEYDETI